MRAVAALLGVIVLCERVQGIDTFGWAPIPPPVGAGYPFPADIRALTGNQVDVGFEGDVELRGVVQAPPTGLVFSELSCSGGSLELVNAGTTPLPVRGTLRIYRRVPSQLPPVELPLLDPSGPPNVVLQPGQIVRLSAFQPTGLLTNGYFRRGSAAMVDAITPGPAAMALIDGSEVIDFWLGTASAAPDLRTGSFPGGAALWEGPELYARSQFLQARVRRVGVARTRSAVDWQIVGFPEPAPARLPLPGTAQVLPVTPSRVHFSGGLWTGSLVVSNASPSAHLVADDLRGHPGESAAFEIRPAPQFSWAVAETNVVLETGTPLSIDLRLSSPLSTNLPVALQTTSPGFFSVPDAVIIPAGETVVRFQAAPVRNSAVDGPQLVSITAAATGIASAAPLPLTLLDADGPNMTLDLSNLPEVPPTFATPFVATLALSKAPDRDVTVTFETTNRKPAMVLPYAHGPVLSSIVVPAGVSRLQVSGNQFPIPFAEPVLYRVRAIVPGWPIAETTVTVLPSPPDPRLELSWGRLFQEGSGPQTNALTITLHRHFPTNVTVRLLSEAPALMSLPETVEIPAYTAFFQVTPVLGEDDLLTGNTIGNVTAEAPGFASISEVFNITDNEAGFLDLSIPSVPGEPAGVSAGVTNSLTVRAYSIWPSFAAFTGVVRVALDAGLQDVRYDGPDTFTMTEGNGRLALRLFGAGFNVRLRFTLPNGSQSFSTPFEVRPDRTVPLEHADLEVNSPATVHVNVGSEETLRFTLRNNGPAKAERLTLLATATAPLLIGSTNTYRMDLGTLASGASRELSLPISSHLPGNGGVVFEVLSDNPDPSVANNTSQTQALIENPPRPGVGELVLPTADLAYSTNTGRFYFSSQGAARDEIVELDPETLQLVRRFAVPSSPGMLAVTSDGRQLYALLAEGTQLVRLDLATWQTNLHVKLASPATDLVTVPTLPQRVVVFEPAAGTQLLNDGLPRGAIAGDYGWLEPDLNGTAIVSYAGNIFRYSASGTALTRQATGSGFFPAVSAWGGFRVLENQVYFADGTRWQSPNTLTTPYLGITGGVDVLPDLANDRIYFAALQGSALELTAHPLARGGEPLAALSLKGVQGSVNRLTRWGTNGLGFRSTGGQLFFVRSALVPFGPAADLRMEVTDLPRSAEDLTYAIRLKVSNAGPNEAADVRVRVTHPADDGVTSEAHLESERPGALSVPVGRLSSGESRTITLQFQAASRGTRTIVALTIAEGPDPDTTNNAATGIVHVKEPGVAALDIAASHLVYDPVGDQFLAAVNFVAGQPANGVLAFDPRSAMPRRWYPLPIIPWHLAPSDDGTVVYIAAADRTEIRRLRLSDGTVEAAGKLTGVLNVGDLLVPPGRPDLLVVSRQRTDQSPSFVDVAVYKGGAKLPGSSNRAGEFLVAPGPVGEVWGASTSAGQFNRFRIDDAGATHLGATGGGIFGNVFGWQVAGDWLVSTVGGVHTRQDGQFSGALPFSVHQTAMATHPTAARVATLAPNFPGLPMSRLTLWDVGTRKAVADRLLTEFPGGANHLAYSAGETFCVGGTASTGSRVIVQPRHQLTGTKLSLAWTTLSRNVGAEPFDTEFVFKNEGADPATNVLVTLPLYPLELVDSSVSSGGTLSVNTLGSAVLSLASMLPGEQITGRLRLRGAAPELVSLIGTVGTSTMLTEPAVLRGDAVMIQAGRVDATLQGIPLSCRDVVADTTRGQLWLALPSPQNALAVLDTQSRQLLDLVRLDYEPNRLAISADGRFLYAAPTVGSIGRVNLGTRTLDLRIPLDANQPELHGANDLVVNPGNAELIAVSSGRIGQGYSARLFEGAIPRSQTYSPGLPLEHLAWLGPDSLGVIYGTDLHRLALTPTGLELAKTYPGVVPAGFPWVAEASGSSVRFHAGPVLDLISGALNNAPSELVFRVADTPRSRSYTVNWGSQFGNPIIREIVAKENASDALVWSASTGLAVGDPYRFLLATPSHLVTLTAGFGESKVLWFTELPPLDAPPALLQLTGGWFFTEISTQFGTPLQLTVLNSGPAPARNLVVTLPEGFDEAFTNLLIDPPTLNAVREGPTVKIPVLPPRIGFRLNCDMVARAVPGQFAPRFRVHSESPATPEPAPSIAPSILIRPAPVASLVPATGTEGTGTGIAGNSAVIATLRLSSKTIVGGSVRAEAIPITATAETDYRFTPTRVAIPAGRETVSIQLPIRADAVAEPTETFLLRLSEPVGVTLGTAEATMTILDDDGPTLNVSGVKVVEGTGPKTTVRIPFTLSAAPVQAARVRYFVNDGTARADSDFSAKQGALEFPTGSLSADLVIDVTGDARPERTETFEVVLLEPAGLRLGTASARVEIQDDDLEPELLLGFARPIQAGGLFFASVEGVTYRLERAESLEGPWMDLGRTVIGTGEVVSIADPLPPTDMAYYRIRRE